jgi:hypothetical protein
MAHPWPTESSGHPYKWRGPDEVNYFIDAPKATGATAGTPGTFTGGTGKANVFAEMSGIVATPATGWTTAQRVVLNDASEAYWNGTAWVAGRVP